MEPTAVDVRERRARVRRELAAGDVASMRDLAGRLQADGIEITPEALRSDVRALGAIRVHHGDDAMLALPVDGAAGGSGSSTERLAAEISSDPDWRIQVGVAIVVAAFVLVALLGWLISV